MGLDLGTLLVVDGAVTILCGILFVLSTSLRRNDRPGRIWSISFIGGMLTTISYGLWFLDPSAWWTIVVGNAGIVLAVGFVWVGLRVFNARRSLLWIVFVGVAVTAVSVLLQGPDGGDWAGASEMFICVSIFACLAGAEALTGSTGANLNARILSATLWSIGVFYALRLIVILTQGPYSDVFNVYFGTEVTTFVAIVFILVCAITLSVLRVERFRVWWSNDTSTDEDPSLGVLTFRTFREGAQDRLARAATTRVKVALIVVEINDLEEMNVAFGRSYGDEAIKTFVGILRRQVPVTALIGRLRAGRFAILTVVTSPADATQLISGIRSALIDAKVDAQQGMRITASFGEADTLSEEASIGQLLWQAEEQLSKTALEK